MGRNKHGTVARQETAAACPPKETTTPRSRVGHKTGGGKGPRANLNVGIDLNGAGQWNGYMEVNNATGAGTDAGTTPARSVTPEPLYGIAQEFSGLAHQPAIPHGVVVGLDDTSTRSEWMAAGAGGGDGDGDGDGDDDDDAEELAPEFFGRRGEAERFAQEADALLFGNTGADYLDQLPGVPGVPDAADAAPVNMCGACTFHNEPGATKCEMCGSALSASGGGGGDPSSQPSVVAPPTASLAGTPTGAGVGHAAEPSTWTCTKCTFLNNSLVTFCSVCDSPCVDGGGAAAPSSTPAPAQAAPARTQPSTPSHAHTPGHSASATPYPPAGPSSHTGTPAGGFQGYRPSPSQACPCPPPQPAHPPHQPAYSPHQPACPPHQPAPHQPPPHQPPALHAMKWNCAACTLENEPGATTCSVCETPRPPAAARPYQAAPRPAAGQPYYSTPPPAAPAYQPYQPHPAQGHAQGHAAPAVPPTSQPSTVWNCGACTLENEMAAMKCAMCDTLRPPHTQPARDGAHHMPSCDGVLGNEIYTMAGLLVKRVHRVVCPWRCGGVQ